MRRHVVPVIVLALVVGSSLTVPAGAANREHQQMMADIRMLQEQVQQLALGLGGLTDALKTVTAKLDEQAGVTRKAFADQKLGSDTISGDLRVIREKVDDNNVRIGTLSQEIEALRLAIPQTPPQPLGGLPGEVTDPSAAAVPPAAAAPAPPLVGSPSQAYDRAYFDYAAGEYSLARAGFQGYLNSFPQAVNAGSAQYYIGEAFRQEGSFQEAIGAYDKVIASYPNSPDVANAFYKRGLAYQSLGDVARARESFEEVIKRYPPENPVAVQAVQALGRLKGKN